MSFHPGPLVHEMPASLIWRPSSVQKIIGLPKTRSFYTLAQPKWIFLVRSGETRCLHAPREEPITLVESIRTQPAVSVLLRIQCETGNGDACHLLIQRTLSAASRAGFQCLPH